MSYTCPVWSCSHIKKRINTVCPRKNEKVHFWSLAFRHAGNSNRTKIAWSVYFHWDILCVRKEKAFSAISPFPLFRDLLTWQICFLFFFFIKIWKFSQGSISLRPDQLNFFLGKVSRRLCRNIDDGCLQGFPNPLQKKKRLIEKSTMPYHTIQI